MEGKDTIYKGKATWRIIDNSCVTILAINFDERQPPPYLRGKHVEAYLDIAVDGTIASIEIVNVNAMPFIDDSVEITTEAWRTGSNPDE